MLLRSSWYRFLRVQTLSVQSKRWKMKVEGSMGAFVQKVCPLTGRIGWELQDENYDYHQEISRSKYADMLHDTDRNKKYHDALKRAIDAKHAQGQKAHVLDIGTGTGLLSIMAANLGADSIVACEAFMPIAEVAARVIKDNCLSERIKVVGKRSTELKVGPGFDLEHRANILVTEVFDTELIGEGAVETFNHANENLLEKGSIIVPWAGRVFAVLTQSPFLASCNRIASTFELDTETAIRMPEEIIKCPGNAGVHDLQVSQVPSEEIKLLSEPVEVFKFNFHETIPHDDASAVNFTVKESGLADTVIVFWTLDMDPDASLEISCAPSFINGGSPWRDHWMQAVYHLKETRPVVKGESLTMLSKHDQYSMWFDVSSFKDSLNRLEPPVCSCGLHGICSRSRIFSINDQKRWKQLLKILKTVQKDSVVLFLGDVSLLPLAAVHVCAKKVYCVADNPMSFRVFQRIIEYNNLENKVVLLEEYKKDLIEDRVDIVLAEPFFRESIFPWDNARVWYDGSRMTTNPSFLPTEMRLTGVPIEFENLQKIHKPLVEVEGFSMSAFDELIEMSSLKSDSEVDVQPLFEYPGRLLGRPETLIRFNFDGVNAPPEKAVRDSGRIAIESTGECHAVALWVEWQFGDSGVTLSNGLVSSSSSDENGDAAAGSSRHWDFGSRQGVYFLKDSPEVKPGDVLNFEVILTPQIGAFGFSFSLNKT